VTTHPIIGVSLSEPLLVSTTAALSTYMVVHMSFRKI